MYFKAFDTNKYSESKNSSIRSRTFDRNHSCVSLIGRKAETVHMFFSVRNSIGQPLGVKWL